MNRRNLFTLLMGAPLGIATCASATSSSVQTPNQMREGLALSPIRRYAEGQGSWVQKSRDADCLRRIRVLRKAIDANDLELKTIQAGYNDLRPGDPRVHECFERCEPIFREAMALESRLEAMERDDPLSWHDVLKMGTT